MWRRGRNITKVNLGKLRKRMSKKIKNEISASGRFRILYKMREFLAVSPFLFHFMGVTGDFIKIHYKVRYYLSMERKGESSTGVVSLFSEFIYRTGRGTCAISNKHKNTKFGSGSIKCNFLFPLGHHKQLKWRRRKAQGTSFRSWCYFNYLLFW